MREFLLAGEINGETTVTNCRDGSCDLVRDIPGLLPETPEAEILQPVRTSIRINLQQRIRDLEEALMVERRAREQAEHRVERLESKLDEITRAASL